MCLLLLAPFILQILDIKILDFKNFFKFQSRSRVTRMCHFWAHNGPFVVNKIFLVQTIIITFIHLLDLFIVQNFKQFLQQIQSYEDAPFLDPKWSICPKQIFFGKLLISFSSIYQSLSLCKILRNSSNESRVIRKRNFRAQNGPFSQMRIFQKTCQ